MKFYTPYIFNSVIFNKYFDMIMIQRSIKKLNQLNVLMTFHLNDATMYVIMSCKWIMSHRILKWSNYSTWWRKLCEVVLMEDICALLWFNFICRVTYWIPHIIVQYHIVHAFSCTFTNKQDLLCWLIWSFSLCLAPCNLHLSINVLWTSSYVLVTCQTW